MNAKISILIILCVFISIPAIADHRNEDNVCFYSKDNYSEKEDGTKFCVPYYTEDEWLFSQWNNNIASIKIPFNLRVDVFSDYSFLGKAASFYKNTNAAELATYGLTADISSYLVLPKNLYSENHRVIFNYHSDIFPDSYFSYDYYVNNGHSILLTKQSQPIDANGQSSYLFYSHAGQIMTAFIGQGFDRNLYCLSPVDRRSNKLDANVAFTYCDFNNSGQNWFPKMVENKLRLVNLGTGSALSLDQIGFYVRLHTGPTNILYGGRNEHSPQSVFIDENTVWFDESTIDTWNENAVRPFLQYKETLESNGVNDHREVITHRLDQPDDTYIYLGNKDGLNHIYYNAETQYLMAYNKLSEGKALIESSCLSLLNDGSDKPSAISFTYHRSNYSDNSLEYRCDNGVAYNMYNKKWYFMADWEYHYLVNGYKNKILHFYMNDKPQYINFRGVLTGPKLGEYIGAAVNFNERTPHDAVFINSPALGYVLDVEKSICALDGLTDDKGMHCSALNATWSATGVGVWDVSLSRDYIPWLLAQISHKLHTSEWTTGLDAYLQKVGTLETFFETNKDHPVDEAIWQQTKALLVEFLHTYNSTEYQQVWHQVAYILNRIEVMMEAKT
ncbi:N-acetyltransferase GCN5 [Yersinia intermedia]|uniref:hypothetical protein n=1 Tax=Yersinia intermedia TaxID=631 RepID=UPI0005E1F2BD|nr:hypothetical protein [Yersinia intermedia]MDA5511861.1 hypothetical protein [Yersinia intermedia]CNI04087.1 N-acetyltransferase GCN5 [Yersinia intermedia]CQD81646.1 N-acetyltransferase GCN5 [Yersinia intermedia]